MITLPDEYRFDVPAAAKSLADVAAADPDAPILLTIGRIEDGTNAAFFRGGIEESDTTMRAEEVAALLSEMAPPFARASVAEDQRIPGVSARLFLLRVSRPAKEPSRETEIGSEW